MKVIYVAGPYRGQNASAIRRNIENARAVAEQLWQEGWAVICPHLNSAFMDGVVPDEAFLNGDIEVLKRCDAVCVTDCWENSAGAKAEVRLALEMNIPIYSLFSHFPFEWDAEAREIHRAKLSQFNSLIRREQPTSPARRGRKVNPFL